MFTHLDHIWHEHCDNPSCYYQNHQVHHFTSSALPPTQRYPLSTRCPMFYLLELWYCKIFYLLGSVHFQRKSPRRGVYKIINWGFVVFLSVSTGLGWPSPEPELDEQQPCSIMRQSRYKRQRPLISVSKRQRPSTSRVTMRYQLKAHPPQLEASVCRFYLPLIATDRPQIIGCLVNSNHCANFCYWI